MVFMGVKAKRLTLQGLFVVVCLLVSLYPVHVTSTWCRYCVPQNQKEMEISGQRTFDLLIPCCGHCTGHEEICGEEATPTTPTTPTTTTGIKEPVQCSEHKVLNEADRNVNIDGCISGCVGQCFCFSDSDQGVKSPLWEGPGYYRFEEPAGIRMAYGESPGVQMCGSYSAGWLMGSHPEVEGVEVDMTACFDYGEEYGDNSECRVTLDITVTKCSLGFVYKLPDSITATDRYCATFD